MHFGSVIHSFVLGLTNDEERTPAALHFHPTEESPSADAYDAA
jgi:hypothetical protein